MKRTPSAAMGAGSGSIQKAIHGAPSLRAAKDRAHDTMRQQMDKAGQKYTPHMEKALLKGVEHAYYDRTRHIAERDRDGN